MTGKDNLTQLCPHCAANHRETGGDCEREPLLGLDHVYKIWDRRAVLEDVSLTIRQGDFLAITGPNGGGKTTLLKILLGLLKPTRGKLIHYRQKLNVGYLPQKNMIDSHFPISVSEVIKSGLRADKDMDKDNRQARYEQVLGQMGLIDHADKPIGVLSGGQLQRALLGRAIISSPDLLVLDEPLSYIDKAFESRLYELIGDLARHTTIVLVSHEMSTIAGMANRHFIVDRKLHACLAEHHFIHSDCDE